MDNPAGKPAPLDLGACMIHTSPVCVCMCAWPHVHAHMYVQLLFFVKLCASINTHVSKHIISVYAFIIEPFRSILPRPLIYSSQEHEPELLLRVLLFRIA